eukprot:Skav216778  [mRNA]  locus=scaffold579:82536:84369:+ [translate_table: standard]
MRFDLLCMMAGALGLLILLFCHFALEETLKEKKVGDPTLPGCSEQGIPSHSPTGIIGVWHFLNELRAPYQLLWSSEFLQIRLAQMLLGQLGNGWESIQDSFMISILGWGPGDWDLFNVPISSFREMWGMVTSGYMVHWAQQPGNGYWFIQANLVFGSAMTLVIQNFGPFGALFLLLPRRLAPCQRCLLALCPGDGGADAAFFSSQFPREAGCEAWSEAWGQPRGVAGQCWSIRGHTGY